MRYFNSKGMSFEKILFDLLKTGFPRAEVQNYRNGKMGVGLLIWT